MAIGARHCYYCLLVEVSVSQRDLVLILMDPRDWCLMPRFKRYGNKQWQFKWLFIYLHSLEQR